MISHRPSTLAWLDRIIVMEDGRIVEEGSPFELLQRGSSEADKAGDENGDDDEGEALDVSNYYRRAVQQEGSQAMELALRWAKGKQTSE
jgi:ABC-type multidrug transport system ATPase subunit